MNKKRRMFPNQPEQYFLDLAYNRFYDIFDEVMEDSFWEKDDWYRFSKIKEVFGIYTELLNYEPIQWVIEKLKIFRPPMESEIGKELFKFIRNTVMHFPFFERWNDVFITKTLVNWYKDKQSIDRFLDKYQGHQEIKYRFWEGEEKRMTYLTISFPKIYKKNTKVYLKDMLSEKEGVKFSFLLMRQILNTQVEKTKEV